MNPLLNVTGLVKSYRVPSGFLGHRTVQALKGIDLHISAGESLGLVGESGSGKTTLARTIMGILKPDAGHVEFDGLRISTLKPAALRASRRSIAIVYQNPYLSLNPRMRIRDLVAEPIITHERISDRALTERVKKLLDEVGLTDAHLSRRVGELSGGQAQRVAIARTLALRPKLVLLDEPTSALDVSVQAQILNLLAELQVSHGNAYLLISHNLDVIRHVTDRVVVMERGSIVETGDTEQVLDRPSHPYTRALVAATLSV